MAESKLRNRAMEFSVEIIKLVKYLKDKRESIIAIRLAAAVLLLVLTFMKPVMPKGGRILYPNWKLL